MKTIYEMLFERFGEPIGDAPAGQGVNDERAGKSSKGKPMGNRGFGSSDSCCEQCGSMPTEMDGACCQNELDEDDLTQKAPPGGEKVVKTLKKKKDVKNPWAVAWAMKNRGEI